MLYLFSHLFVSRRSLFARRVSSFNTCFVNTPRQRNLIPPFINSRITFSPSWLIVVMCFISITSSRPRRSALASAHALLSSAAQGAMSFPSTISRRCLALSIERDLQHSFFPLAIRQGAHQTLRSRKSLNFQESNARNRNIEVEEVESVETVERYGELDGLVQIKHTASHRCRISSFEKGKSCGSFPGVRQHHRHRRRAPCMQSAPV